LIRAVGPALIPFGVGGVLADPQLSLFRSVSGASVLQTTNDNWAANAAGSAALTTAFDQVGAFHLDATSKDAVLLVTLQPGAYSAQVTGVNSTTGVALIE